MSFSAGVKFEVKVSPTKSQYSVYNSSGMTHFRQFRLRDWPYNTIYRVYISFLLMCLLYTSVSHVISVIFGI